MRIIDDTRGTVGPQVASEEEALVALSQGLDRRIQDGLSWGVLSCEEPGDDASDDDAKRRTVRDVAAEAAVLGGALGGSGVVRFDGFTAANVAAWPVKISELRRDGALADADLGALAAHLNARLRGDVAKVLRDCADFGSPRWERRKFGDEESEETRTAWDCFCVDGDLYELSLGEVVEAIRGGPPSWEALDEWTPAGGVDGDPFTVRRFAWGPLRARVELQAAELLESYLAGDAELVLRRTVIDFGKGATEIIWPEQPRVCCGYSCGFDELPPISVHRAFRPDAALSARGRICRVCMVARYASILTCRAVDGDATTPLGAVETIDGLPNGTLAAIARDGAAAVARDLPR